MMTITNETVSRIRVAALGATGLACVTYAALAVWFGRPDPIGWYWPGLAGLAASLVIMAAFGAGGRGAAAAADELHDEVNHRAQRHAYWLSLALFGALSLSSALGWLEFHTAMAVFGCLMGASYLLLFVLYDLRTR
jgi:hypothetical protein